MARRWHTAWSRRLVTDLTQAQDTSRWALSAQALRETQQGVVHPQERL